MKLDLLGTGQRIETPYIQVQIGKYIFGSYDKSVITLKDFRGSNLINKITYPNYIKNLDISKVNGIINKYTLKLEYAITENDDPNFFEKVFSSVSDSRKIVFSYGDLSLPSYIYKNEEAVILKVKENVSVVSSVISYTVSAISISGVSNPCSQSFGGYYRKPSDEIKDLLRNNTVGLVELFPGMRGLSEQQYSQLISSDDKEVYINQKINISPLDYLNYLVSLMSPVIAGDSLLKGSFYNLVILDELNDNYDGTYFKVVRSDKQLNVNAPYRIDIGLPTKDIITGFEVEDDESYAIYYKYSNDISTNNYVQRIDDTGEFIDVYAPIIGSNSRQRVTREDDITWWTKMTEFPIKASITLKGLLRPSVLTTYVDLNIYFYGRKHVHSGLYIVTEERDSISESGYRTTLKLLRVSGSEME